MSIILTPPRKLPPAIREVINSLDADLIEGKISEGQHEFLIEALLDLLETSSSVEQPERHCDVLRLEPRDHRLA